MVDNCEATALIADARHGEVGDHVAGAAAPGATVRLAVGGAIDGFEPYDEALGGRGRHRPRGRRVGSARCSTPRAPPGDPRGSADPRPYRQVGMIAGLFGYQAGQDVHLVHRPAVPRRPAGLLAAVPLVSGAGIVTMERWDPEEALRLIETHRITHTHMVPTMFVQLLKLPEEVRNRYDVSSLRHVLHGAAPCPVHVKHALIEWLGPIVFEYYAATEGTGTMVDSTTWLSRPGTVGKVIPEDQVKVGRRRGQRAAPQRGRHRVLEGARRSAASSTSRPRRRPTPPTGATTTRWATSDTWTRRASSSSPTAASTSSSRAA